MTMMRLFVAGEIKKCESKQAGDKSILEVSVCKKFKGRNGAEDTFSWVRLTIWEPAPFLVEKAKVGAFIAATGDYQLRSFVAKDGSRGHSAVARCTSFDCEISDGTPREKAPAAQRTEPKVNVAMSKPMAGGAPDDSVPFSPHDKWSWG